MADVGEPFDQASVYSRVSKTVQFKQGTKLINWLNVKEGNNVLDVGCGTGLMCKVLADMVGPTGRISGVDPDGARLQLARSSCGGYNNITFYNSRSHDFPIDKRMPYDAVISNIVYHWVPDQEKIDSFARVYESLKPGGKFAASIINGVVANALVFIQAYAKTDPEFVAAYQKSLSSCLFFVSGEWLLQQLSKIGFINIQIEHADDVYSVPTFDDFVNWCIASTANSAFMNLDIKSRFAGMKESVNLAYLPNGEIEMKYPTYFVLAEKPLHQEDIE